MIHLTYSRRSESLFEQSASDVEPIAEGDGGGRS
jgi:hypothetical protein